jgi:CPA1 family monovalent cation:H+ antiporter
MTLFALCSIIIALSAMFGYINARFLRLPNTIGLMIVAIGFTLFLFATTLFTDYFLNAAHYLISLIDFQEVLLDVMLGFLLFAGAIHTNFDQLHVQRWPVLVFSTLGVLASTFLCATFVYFGFRLIGLDVQYIHCLLFGALISPTDPIAVLGILKQARVPKKLETKIVGESLFNDGVGVVVFLTIFSLATGGAHPGETAVGHVDHPAAVQSHKLDASDHSKHQTELETSPTSEGTEQPQDTNELHATAKPTRSLTETVWSVIKLFTTEVLGGILLGLVFGTITYLLLRSIDDYEIEVLITLACVMGGYSLATYLHLSAPLAIVVAGLVVGNDTVRGTAMSSQTELYVDKFWELMDILLNAVLFVLIGLELLVLKIEDQYLWAALMTIVIVLVSRFLSLLIPVRFFARRLDFVPHTTTIMTWGGLRGGISIALALTLTADMNRDLFLTVTYAVVIFSIVVQGLSVGKLAKKLIGIDNEAQAAD